jgi:putative pyruvate formate lyase activating enzyme
VVERLTRNEQVVGSTPTSGCLREWLADCRVCPNFCRVNRLAGARGRCRTGAELVVSSADLHFGEESVLVGRGGSGTIFFTACNLGCLFCQNYDISQLDRGRTVSAGELAGLALALQARGAENINLVTPTHQAPLIFEALGEARRRGLRLPIVYNCGGYENPEFLRELAGLVDIYMPDFKYGADAEGERLSGVREYARWCREGLREMHRQVGDLAVDRRGVAVSGLLVRHLVLPRGLARSREVIDFLYEGISPDTFLNVMDQYHPSHRAGEVRELDRRVLRQEVEEVLDYARAKGLRRVMG